MEFTPGQLKLLAYWGEIQSGVAQRVQTADLWEIVRNAATREGASLQGVGAIDMGVLRSIAVSQRNAMTALQRAGPGEVITDQMIGRDVSSRSQLDQNLAPKWIVRFEHDLSMEGQLVTVWRSSTFEGVGKLPPTLSALRDQVEQDAQQLAESSSGGPSFSQAQHVGVGTMSIVAV